MHTRIQSFKFAYLYGLHRGAKFKGSERGTEMERPDIAKHKNSVPD